jgi:exosortase/archaeosortase family protein
MRRALPGLALAAAAWPSFAWYREELELQTWSLVPLALALAHVVDRARTRPAMPFDRLPVLCVIGYALTQPVLPPIFAALWIVVAATCIASAAAGRDRPSAGLAGLFLLALPVVPSAQLLVGYPLRVISAELAAACLMLSGSIAVRSGAVLEIGGERVAIDAPCSGVKMWWAALLLAAWCATRADWGVIKTLGAAVIATGTILIANALRSAALVQLGALRFEAPGWMHEGIGLVSFALCVIPVLWVHDRYMRKESTCRTA